MIHQNKTGFSPVKFLKPDCPPGKSGRPQIPYGQKQQNNSKKQTLSHRFPMNRRRKREHIFISHTGRFYLQSNTRAFPFPAIHDRRESIFRFFQYTIQPARPATGSSIYCPRHPSTGRYTACFLQHPFVGYAVTSSNWELYNSA